MFFLSEKLILAEIMYKSDKQELLAIIKMLKTSQNYLKSCIFQVLILNNHNNLN